ncbi:DUF4391 domain-containing protein [uncultured Clostridium sp.]|uniref:DUF4391 domain-containing protein n=1 Tax=uncultured Clostridium sp. TaxID=59620 RepID=UPI0025EE8B35|nr:DUF4391 domain-containing protein [uncultured Clostridium sp.]
MFGLDDKYKLNKKIDVKTFIKKDFNVSDKKRLKESLKNVTLVYQLVGEDIPSIINEEYNCQAILFLDIEINNIKNVSFVGGIIQGEIKSFCIMKIHDKNTQRYYFAEKRLNLQDNNNIIIENIVITKESSIFFFDDWVERLEYYLKFSNIILKENKLFFYREMMTKAFIISELNFDFEGNKLLESNLWYNSRKVKEVLINLKEVEKLKLQLKKIKEIKEKVSVNKEIKNLNEKIMKSV